MLSVLLALSVAACFSDPFGFPQRTVTSGYRLMQWEDDTLWLIDPSDPNDPVGPVVQIGWNDRVIVIQRKNDNGDSRDDGFMTIDLRNRTVTGPTAVPPAEITLTRVSDAWRKLGR
jgi:hypothetical protein